MIENIIGYILLMLFVFWFLFVLSAIIAEEIDSAFIKPEKKCRELHRQSWLFKEHHSGLPFNDMYTPGSYPMDIYYCPLCERKRFN